MNAKQCRMARAGLNISGRDLAEIAEVGYATIARFESGSAISNETRLKIAEALIASGVQFASRGGRVTVSLPAHEMEGELVKG